MKNHLITLIDELVTIAEDYDPYGFDDAFNSRDDAIESIQDCVMDDVNEAINYLDYIMDDDRFTDRAKALKAKFLPFVR